MKPRQLFSCLSIAVLSFCLPVQAEFVVKETQAIAFSRDWREDVAIQAAARDLADTLKSRFSILPKILPGSSAESLPAGSVVIGNAANSVIAELIRRGTLTIPELSKDGFTIKSLSDDGKPLLIVCGKSIRACCYGVYHLIERIRLGNLQSDPPIDIVKKPDMTFRMMTQPFEVSGYSPVARAPKPIAAPRSFDPMRPTEGAGYDPEDEARNILRAGLNVFYIGSYAFATLYDRWESPIHAEGSKVWDWVVKRRDVFRRSIDAAQKYHLDICVNGDVFVFPKNADGKEKWELLEYSLNEILTDFPEIDCVMSRFGENYADYNDYFAGVLVDKDEIARAIDLIYDIAVTKHRKTYICRAWAIGSETWHSDTERYGKIEKDIEAGEGLTFSFKNTHTDFWRYNKLNPCIGIGQHAQAQEYLCQNSYHYKQAFPSYEVLRMAKGAKELGENSGMPEAYKRGVRHAWGWLTADGGCGPYIQREEWLLSNIFGFTHLVWDVDADPYLLARDWAAIEFGVEPDSKVTQNLADILTLSEELILKLRYFREYALSEDPWSPCRNWMRDELVAGGEVSSTEKSCGRAARSGTLRPIFNPKTLEKDCAEKEEAMAIVDRMVRKFEEILPEIPDTEKAQDLLNTLVYAKYFTHSISHYAIGMFRYYNGETERAEKHLNEWKRNWETYQNEVPHLSGVPTLIKDGGMEETCTSALADIERQR